jgi:hypothetical protein
MSDTPPTGAEWVEAIVKALHLGYLDALDDVQDRLKDVGWLCNVCRRMNQAAYRSRIREQRLWKEVHE